MADKPVTKMSYRELTINQLIVNERVASHLCRIDKHLETQNGRVDKNETGIQKNKERISKIQGVAIGVISLLGIVIIILSFLLAFVH
jgi:uncharacterized membrane protein YukC